MIEWNEYWQKYSTSKAEKWLILERDKIINYYLDRIVGTKKVIEVGCGYGTNSRLIMHNRKDVESYALDNSIVAIKRVKEDIRFSFCADCCYTPFTDNKFDVIFSSGLMEHFKDESAFLSEMDRILKDSGYLITFVPAKYSLWQVYRLLHFNKWQHGYEKSYSYEQLEDIFVQHRFNVLKIIGIDPFSINGLIMKLLNISFPAGATAEAGQAGLEFIPEGIRGLRSNSPIIRQSFFRSGYTELCVIAKKV
ncbi:MAG: class I SAM-dependent methyltransferase [Candidatus Stahlbacteria bacterium]|nr:class I SAM-dependent methyltransferase [Candidatus Stahlbacteria bacterium]